MAKQVQLNVKMPVEMRNRIDKMQKQVKAKTITETVMRALRLYDSYLAIVNSGGKVIHEDKNGKREVVRYL